MPFSPSSSERARVILEERARALARPLAEPAAEDLLDAVTFELRGERYAVESRFVLEMFRAVAVTPLPGAEPPVFGVTAWRGELLPVVDLRSLLGLSPAVPGAGALLVVLGRDRAVLSVQADAPGDVLALRPAAIRPATGIAAAEYVRGMTPRAEVWLDVEKLLSIVGPEPV